MVNCRRIAWLGYIERLDELWLAKKITEWKPIVFRWKGKT
jgi:hypothetical protein